MAFDRNQGIPSTFFVGASNGSHLSYGQDVAGAWIKKIKERGFEVGVHGIAYDEGEAMVRERNSFRRMSGLNTFGMRMHYLRKAPNTIYRLAEIGYTFDSSETATTNPYKIGRMWEFPRTSMDGDILCNGARWQQRDLGEACHVTRQRLDEALVAGIRYFTLLFHDRYFSDEFKTWKDWYIWSIDLIKRSGFEFASYDRAMKDLVQSSEE